MSPLLGLGVAAYVFFLFFLAALALNVGKYVKLSAHLRWELYPVPHEEGHAHGGSYLERVGWWQGVPKRYRGSELKELLGEMLFIKRLYRAKRDVWIFSFLFHGGIYLILLWYVLLFVGALTQALYVPVSLAQWAAYPNALSKLIFYATIVAGYVGVSASTVGDLGLLAKRSLNKNVRDVSTPADYFSLLLVLAVLISGVAALTQDPTFNVARDFMTYLISGLHINSAYLVYLRRVTNPAIATQLILLFVLLTYMPFSKMTHFLAKYFTYHAVLWDSAPFAELPKSTKMKIIRNLSLELAWAAQHVPRAKWGEVNRHEGQ